MSEKIITFIVHFVTHVISLGGYAGIVALMGIESACIPLPSEIIMTFAGFLVYPANPHGHFSLFWAATAGAVGCNLGSLVAYWIGAWGGRPLVERYGRWVLMSHHDLDRMTEFFAKFGSIPAGIAKMPQLRFHIYTFLGSWPWCYALAYAGMRLGVAWHTDPRFQAAFHRFHLGVEVALVAGIIWFVWSHLRRGRRAEASLASERDAVSAANGTK
jgi:membrane protein DedA with SNARE-associated domain